MSRSPGMSHIDTQFEYRQRMHRIGLRIQGYSAVQHEFDTCDLDTTDDERLIALLQWNDPNGDYVRLERRELLECIVSQRSVS